MNKTTKNSDGRFILANATNLIIQNLITLCKTNLLLAINISYNCQPHHIHYIQITVAFPP